MRTIVLLFTLTALALAERPNIVFFISDDHGYRDSSVYGSDVVRTPNLDRLAADGATFTNVFVGSPACAPSRAVLMTGLMPVRNGVEPNHTPIREGLRLLPQYLEDLGYEPALFGKVGHGRKEPRLEPYYHEATIRHGPLDIDLQPEKVIEFLRDRDRDEPLLLMVGTHSPHVYWPPNQGYDPNEAELPPTFIETPETRRYRTMYFTDVTLMDERLGVVYDAVREKLGENTLFIYTSDHGAQWPFGKWNLYDAGIRAPFLAVWPGVIEPQSRNETLISFADLLPTLLELAGGEAPLSLDGVSFARALRGEAAGLRSAIYAHHAGDGRMNVYPMRAIRTERYKLILNLHPEFFYTTHIDAGKNADGLEFWRSWERAAENDAAAARIVQAYRQRPAVELFDVRADPHETRNLAGRPAVAAIESELRQRLENWMALQNDGRRHFGEPRLLEDAALEGALQ